MLEDLFDAKEQPSRNSSQEAQPGYSAQSGRRDRYFLPHDTDRLAFHLADGVDELRKPLPFSMVPFSQALKARASQLFSAFVRCIFSSKK
jgi:hypothetical protein